MKINYEEVKINCVCCGQEMTVYQNIQTGDVSEIYCDYCIEEMTTNDSNKDED